MTKTPDEIKKGLECCCDLMGVMCPYCPYAEDGDASETCREEMAGDSLALIQQLEKRAIHLEALNQSNLTTITMQERTRARLQERISQLEAELDAMKEALGLMVYQYCVSGTELDHRYMCAGETAFRVLGLEQYGDTRTLESWLFPECQEPEA